MKKLTVLLLVAIMALSLMACANTNKEEPLSGGWEKSEDGKITDEVAEAVKKATEDLVGADYEAVSLIESQVVAGMNYRVLCKVTPVVPDPEESYVILTIYADLDGNATISATEDAEAPN